MRTSHARRWTAVAVAAALGLAATACSDDGEDAGGSAPAADAVEVLGEGDRYEATIRRTAEGVPHIVGETSLDVAFGQGWASAEDRACDLADQVVKIRGERARWHGAGEDGEHLDSDVAWRAIGIFERASEDWESVPDDIRELFTAFIDGWNAHLAEVGADGLDGWCAGEPWVRPLEPVELYAYARSLALMASSVQLVPFIASAAPPGADETGAYPPTTAGEGDAPDATTETTDEAEAAAPDPAELAAGFATLGPPPVASNGWAIGAERTADGGGMLVANPHFPWDGELRFWEAHLTVPGEYDVYGAQLSGLPGIGIGFTDEFAWTHTVSAGNRFTAYRLELVPGSPTTYRYGDGTREIEPVEHTIEVLGEDGEVETVTRTTWHSHYGPVIDFPGFGWTESATITFRDANLDNDEFVEQYTRILEAEDLDEFIEIHREINGVPLFNTIAVSADGRAWYADTSATPKLSDEALAAYERLLAEDPIVAIAAENQAVLLDGSDPIFEWEEVDGARDPGLVPFDEQPQVERSDYVFNANDPFWVSHARELLAGDYSPLHGRQGVPVSARTRENALVLDDTSPNGPAGEDGRFTLEELADAALLNRSFLARELLDDVVARCRGAAPVEVPEEPSDGEGAGLPAGTVDVSEACAVLASWDGIYDLDRSGPPIWRETILRLVDDGLGGDGPLWAEPFDPARPVETPAGLAPPPADGSPDPVLVALARTVQTLKAAGIPLDATLGDVQFAPRGGERVPVHGGYGAEGTTNVIGWGTSWTILDPELAELRDSYERLVTGSGLARVDGEVGYAVNNGTSFLLAVAFGDEGPRAKAHLTYGNTSDRDDPRFAEATRRFADKAWRDVPWTEDEVEAAAESTYRVRG